MKLTLGLILVAAACICKIQGASIMEAKAEAVPQPEAEAEAVPQPEADAEDFPTIEDLREADATLEDDPSQNASPTPQSQSSLAAATAASATRIGNLQRSGNTNFPINYCGKQYTCTAQVRGKRCGTKLAWNASVTCPGIAGHTGSHGGCRCKGKTCAVRNATDNFLKAAKPC